MKGTGLIQEAIRVVPGRPNLTAGIRAGVAVTVPLVLAIALKRGDLVWASIGGFNAILADKGGAYRRRALTLLALGLGSALAVLLGTWAAPHLAAALPLLLVTVTLCGFAGVIGAEATSVGVSVAVVLVVALSLPAGDGLSRAGCVLGGVAFVAGYSLLLWPVRPFRPSRLAVAAAARAVAALAAKLPQAGPDEAWLATRNALTMAARQAIEGARTTMGLFRRGRSGPSRRGEQLIMLLEETDQLFADLVALEDALAGGRLPPEAPLRGVVIRACAAVAGALGRLADAVEDERALLAEPEEPVESAAGDAEIAAILAGVRARLEELGETSRALDDPDDAAPSCREAPGPRAVETPAWVSAVRDNLTLDSAALRHALRMSLSTAVAFVVVRALHVERGYWSTLTCLVILQPQGTATFAKAIQRVGGTIVGAAVAIAVASLIHDPRVVLGVVFVSTVTGVALLPLNYGMFAVFLTPSFVLLAEATTGDAGLARVRIVNTLAGAAFSLVGARLLFPLSEREQFPARMADAFDALRALLDAARPEAPVMAEVDAARARAGLALLNAEASMARLLTESAAGEEGEALATVLLYAHRLGSSFIYVAVSRSGPLLAEQGPALSAALADLRDALATGRAPCPLPGGRATLTPLPGAPPGPFSRLDTILGMLAVEHSAVCRWLAARRASGGGGLDERRS